MANAPAVSLLSAPGTSSLAFWRDGRRITTDRTETRRERSRFARVRAAEREFARRLSGLARHVGDLARAFAPSEPEAMVLLEEALARYAGVIRPWARATAARMLADVARRDEAAWNEIARGMSRDLRAEIQGAPTGELLRGLLDEQVELITSLPLEAARRVHEWTLRGLERAERPEVVAAEIMRTGEVTRSRAMLIATTEVATTASKLVEARATWVGSEGYIWTAVMDSDTRPLHRKLHGTFQRWDSPPVAGSRGARAHAGQIYRCRCFPDPVIPEEV
jgi:SPP1 gp7 family putative phage head morphogenesis protein